MKITIESITEWEKDDAEIEGDMSHGGSPQSDILRQLAKETEEKKESEWTKGLPFTWEDDVELDFNEAIDIGHDVQQYIDDALTQYSDMYCAADYLKPSRCEGRLVL